MITDLCGELKKNHRVIKVIKVNYHFRKSYNIFFLFDLVSRVGKVSKVNKMSNVVKVVNYHFLKSYNLFLTW